jgi:mannose/cellobiose epimerase-like protein (N-acyl-D-glucosamine 2-epimerase family)
MPDRYRHHGAGARLDVLEDGTRPDYVEPGHGHEWSAMAAHYAARNLVVVARALKAVPLPKPEA